MLQAISAGSAYIATATMNAAISKATNPLRLFAIQCNMTVASPL